MLDHISLVFFMYNGFGYRMLDIEDNTLALHSITLLYMVLIIITACTLLTLNLFGLVLLFIRIHAQSKSLQFLMNRTPNSHLHVLRDLGWKFS
jgi:hypothetical protein